MEFFQPVFESCKQFQGDCKVNFADLTDFEWDRMAFVQMQVSDAEVAQALGITEIDRAEFEDWIIFLRDDKIVHHLVRAYHPEKPFDRTIFFDFGDRQGQIRIFSEEEAVFKAVVDQGEGIVNIDLEPWE